MNKPLLKKSREETSQRNRTHALHKIIMVSVCMVITLLSCISVYAAPAGPSITYISNSTAAVINANRSQDTKGTITTLTMALNQQSYKWKAYVGNVTGSLALDDANGKSIYDWSLASISGEVYATRSSSTPNWANVSCVNQTLIDAEQAALGIIASSQDSLNKTFMYVNHTTFIVGTKTIAADTCRSTATYINDTAQQVNTTARFQEVLLRDDLSSFMIYTALINDNQLDYAGTGTVDFQMIIAENESSVIPTTYFFYAELG